MPILTKNSRIMVLHHQPTAGLLHHHKSADMSLVIMRGPIRRNPRAHHAGHGDNRNAARGEPYRLIIDRIRDTFQEGGVHLADLFEHVLASACPPAQWIDVVPILGREVTCTVKSIIESRVKGFDGLPHRCFPVGNPSTWPIFHYFAWSFPCCVNVTSLSLSLGCGRLTAEDSCIQSREFIEAGWLPTKNGGDYR